MVGTTFFKSVNLRAVYIKKPVAIYSTKENDIAGIPGFTGFENTTGCRIGSTLEQIC